MEDYLRFVDGLSAWSTFFSWLLIPVFFWTGYRIVQRMRKFEPQEKRDVILFFICAILLYLPLLGNYMWNLMGH